MIICGVLLLALLAQTFYRPSILLSYYMNTAAYARDCINKARPMLHCNGQCVLMKKIREAEKKDKELPERKFGQTEVLFSDAAFAILPSRHIYQVTNSYPDLITWMPTRYSTSIFHPPSIS